jgi:hypothetical protein
VSVDGGRGAGCEKPTAQALFELVGALLATPCRAFPGAFTRGGPLSPDLLVTLVLYMVADGNRRGYSQLLEAFWDEAKSFELPLPTDEPVSGPAFCNARKKFPSAVMRDLIHGVVEPFEKDFGSSLRWNGRRAFAVDGMKVNVQRSDALAQAFGVPSGAYCPQVLVSTLYDLTGKMPHDVIVDRYDSSEREHLVLLLDRLRPGDILVLDRGYPSFEILWMLIDAGIDFVIRVPRSATFKAVDDFVNSGGDDYRILVDPPQGHPMRERGPVEVRALRISARNGEESVLLTSFRRSEFSKGKIGDLYHLRWQIEELYKVEKSDYLGQSQFHSKSPDGVRQEIYALTLFVAITRFLMAAAAREHQVSYEELSPKSGVLGLAAYITRILLASDPDRAVTILEQLLMRIVRSRAPKRPGRRYPRRSYKPARKWGPAGRRGG